MLVIGMVVSLMISAFMHKSIVTNAITNDFIYKFLLPVIVLAEGFNMRKRSLNVYKNEVIATGILIPFFTFSLTAVVIILLQKYGEKFFGIPPSRILSREVLISIAITLNTVEIHGSVAPLHAVKNLRLYKILFAGGMFNNNLSLIIVMTFERLILTKSTLDSVRFQ
jgi:NhaP-type Na+/H+ or K+/H+ antiporter